jgi:acyl-CoA synthetase (AMP-forming)/AMP-acid ligase II
MSLLQRLEQANYQTTAIVAESDCSFSELIANARQIRNRFTVLKHQAVALRFTDLSSFCTQILAFDGWCAKLYLLPDTALPPDDLILFPEGVIRIASQPEYRELHSNEIATDWFMATSGTTATPKWIGHTLDSLTRAVKVSLNNAALCWALCYQPTRFAGLQVVLQSLLTGATLVDCSNGDAAQRLTKMQRGAVNAISATPSLWRQLLMTDELLSLPLKQITLGGEIAGQRLLDTLAALFPQAKLLHIYASTEAGVGFAVSDKKAGFPLNWLKQGHNGLRFKVDSQQHLWLKPPHKPDSKLADRIDVDGFLDSEDLVEVTEDRVYFLGRASGVINVGGNKVQPEQIEQVLLQHPAVLQARVYGKSNSVLGQLVAADLQVVPEHNIKTLKLQLIQHCMTSLTRYQLPTQLNFVDNIATNASGKLSRKREDKE